ncbi:MAG TPA: putative glycoside hydrolase [Paludibacteraceae bacterium]|nr:putative glycoside hydrolase [Paludibacteraceae bacterium]HQF49455.1 putative glycoside hydrolase [Paludibacteraceae bacterium]HQJ89429.1 putative glycoside hydrolase [Paludibacteraceae bacterium]
MNYHKKAILWTVLSSFVLIGCTNQGSPSNKSEQNKEVKAVDSTAAAVDSSVVKSDSIVADSVVVTEEPKDLIVNFACDTIQGKVTRRAHPPVKGIYVSGPIAGHHRFKDLLRMVDNTELNAMVIDVKNDNGEVTYKMDCGLVNELGVSRRYIRDIHALLDTLHKKGIYVIGRVVTFRDPMLSQKKQSWCVHRKDGSIYKDRSGLSWVNPYNREYWRYIIGIGVRAAFDGFDEIQFDYIRFSTEVKDSEVNYEFDSKTLTKRQIITEFVKYSAERMSAHNIEFSADVFGTVIDNDVDSRDVGQDYVQMGKYANTLSPMVYPSHYNKMVYRLDIPNNHPYKAVLSALKASKRVLDTLSVSERPNVRAWLQDFSAPWVAGAHKYTPADVRAQIQAVYDAGYDEWLLWNASIRYRESALKSATGKLDSSLVNQVEKKEKADSFAVKTEKKKEKLTDSILVKK